MNKTFVATKSVVYLFMVGAAALSFMHIVETGVKLGLGWEAWTVPAFVDGLAMLGLIGRGANFAERTQRIGTGFAVCAGSLSLACNVYAGENLGQRLFGVLVVAGFIATELYAAHMHAAPAPPAGPTAEEIAAAELAAKRSASARKAADTRKRNSEAAAKSERASVRAARRALAEATA